MLVSETEKTVIKMNWKLISGETQFMWVLFAPDPLHFSAWCWTKVQVRNLPHTTAERKKNIGLKKAALLMWNRLLFIFQCENAFWTVANFRPITKSVAHHWSEKGKMRSGIPQRETRRTKWRSHRRLAFLSLGWRSGDCIIH